MQVAVEKHVKADAASEASPDGRGSGQARSGECDSKELGRRGEAAAAAFLRRQGFEIVETNWQCIAGEVDIIARDDDTLRFIEVKTRRGIGRGFPAEAVTRKKRERYERIAELYLEQCDCCDIRVCFDVISIVVTTGDRAFLRMHCNAFCFD